MIQDMALDTEFKGGDSFFNQMKEAGIADEEFIKNIVQTFLGESETTLTELGGAYEVEDVKMLKMKAHKLKAGFLMFDLTEEHAIASRLEKVEIVDENQFGLINELKSLCQVKFELLNNKYIKG